MSDYTFTISVRIPGVDDIRPHLADIAETVSEYVDLSGALSSTGANGFPEWDVTASAPATAHIEGESRWELEADWETASASLEVDFPGAVLELTEEWRGDGEPTSGAFTWIGGTLQRTALEAARAALQTALDNRTTQGMSPVIEAAKALLVVTA